MIQQLIYFYILFEIAFVRSQIVSFDSINDDIGTKISPLQKDKNYIEQYFSLQKNQDNISFIFQQTSVLGSRQPPIPSKFAPVTPTKLENLILIKDKNNNVKNSSLVEPGPIFVDGMRLDVKIGADYHAPDYDYQQPIQQNQSVNTSQLKQYITENQTNEDPKNYELDLQNTPISYLQLVRNNQSNFTNGTQGPVLYNGPSFLGFIEYIRLNYYSSVNTIRSYQFENVGFYHQLPLQLAEGELYQFSGQITRTDIKANRKVVAVTIIFSQIKTNSTPRRIICTQPKVHNLVFNISCKIQYSGVYNMYVFIDNEGKKDLRERKVIKLGSLIKSQTQEPYQLQPNGLRMEVINNSLYFLWDSNASLTNLTIYQLNDQNIKKREYLLSNYHFQFKVPFGDFQNFSSTTTYAEISHAKSMSGSLNIIFTKFSTNRSKITFQATDHFYDIISSKVVLNSTILWRLGVSQKFILNVSFTQKVQKTIYITQPGLKIKKFYFTRLQPSDLSNKTIQPFIPLAIQISFQNPGTYLIQVNNADGVALINFPIYVGVAYPLIPDYRDQIPLLTIRSNTDQSYKSIYQRYFSRTIQPLNITQPERSSTALQKKQYLLNLINILRVKYNLSPVELDEGVLQKMAQDHSNDMVLRSYFAHRSPDNLSVRDRARRVNYSKPLGQNIAASKLLSQNHLQLARSAIHLQNILGRSWTRVGIGIAISNTNNKYIITYIFSVRDYKKNPLKKQQKQVLKNQILSIMQEKNSAASLIENKQIQEEILSWIQSDRSQKLLFYIYERKKIQNMRGFVLRLSFTGNWINDLRRGNLLDGVAKANQVAIGIGNQVGVLFEVYVVYT